ncbi:MAG: hypothetical protein ACI8RD_005052 [Bacillariaceae sp.]|jgi:hypothetical protein
MLVFFLLGAPFSEPVDWRGLELFDYPKIISNMMDLGTIKRRLERGAYLNAHLVAEDVRLVWKNCMTYNLEGSDFWLLAKSYARRFEDRYRKVRQEYDVGETAAASGGGGGGKSKSNRPSSPTNFTMVEAVTSPTGIDLMPPTLDARARFGSNLFLLSGVEMGHVLATCELECPEALETCGGKLSIEINVDKIPTEVFANLNTYVTSKVGNNNNMAGSSPGSDNNNGGGGGARSRKRQRK